MMSFVVGNFRHFDPLEFQSLFASHKNNDNNNANVLMESEIEKRTSIPFHSALKPLLVSTSPSYEVVNAAVLEEACKSAPCLLIYHDGSLASREKYVKDVSSSSSVVLVSR